MPLRHTYFTPGIVAALLCSLCSVPSVRGQERLTSTASNSPLQTEFENRSLRPGTDMRDAYLRNPALIHRMVGERRYFSAENPGFVREKPGTIFIAADGASGRQEGDYLLPEIELNVTMEKPLGKYGRMRRAYLKENNPILYSDLVLAEKLFPHLQEIDETAHRRLDQLMKELLEKNPAPDKKLNQMGWVRHLNSLKAQAEEIILAELINN